MPILKGTGNTLLCPRFAYGKRISTRAKGVNSENRHRHEWLEGGQLTHAERALIERLFRNLDANPHASVSWEEAKLRLMAPFKGCAA
jgi:hypothetical protein